MIVSRRRAVLPYDIRAVWDTVRRVEGYAWRSDLRGVKCVGRRVFWEYTKTGFATRFTVTAEQPYRLWAFDLENETLRGHWVGVFRPCGGKTAVTFTEAVCLRRPMPCVFVRLYLWRQQGRFLRDLRRALRKRNHIEKKTVRF